MLQGERQGWMKNYMLGIRVSLFNYCLTDLRAVWKMTIKWNQLKIKKEKWDLFVPHSSCDLLFQLKSINDWDWGNVYDWWLSVAASSRDALDLSEGVYNLAGSKRSSVYENAIHLCLLFIIDLCYQEYFSEISLSSIRFISVVCYFSFFIHFLLTSCSWINPM